MKKLVIALSVAASLAGFSCPAFADNGVISRNAVHKNWYSLQVCYTTHCAWRATTFATNAEGELFAIDFFDDGRMPELSVIRNGIRPKSMDSRDEDTDDVSLRFRVDGQPIVDTTGKRRMDSRARALVLRVPSRPEILEDIRNGNTLRIQSDVNGSKLTHVFSLSGASAAMDRAQRNVGSSPPSTPRQRRRSADDDFFSESAPVQNSSDQI